MYMRIHVYIEKEDVRRRCYDIYCPASERLGSREHGFVLHVILNIKVTTDNRLENLQAH
jgi:hypothetical protein